MTKVKKIHFEIIKFVLSSVLLIPVTSYAGGVTYKDGDKYIKIGGRLQLQYHQVKPDTGSSADGIFFRRLRPYIEGSSHKNWKAKVQWDMGKASGDNEVSVKDAYFQYQGIKNIKVTIGNANFPFSRELLTSSKYQQLVSRTFVGDHNYGTPSRNLGVHFLGDNESKDITWGAAATFAAVDPDAKKLDFDTPVNNSKDYNEGIMIGGRIDYHPYGKLKFSQGDFSGKTKATIGVAAYSWNNDGDNNTNIPGATSKVDIDAVTAFEISGAFRSAGFSVDVQYNAFDADTVETGFTGGLYINGSTKLTSAAIEGGYMVDKDIEIVTAYETQDADGYADSWNRASVGVNWFINQHDTKIQLSYRMGENLNGVDNKDEDEVFLQTQFVF